MNWKWLEEGKGRTDLGDDWLVEDGSLQHEDEGTVIRSEVVRDTGETLVELAVGTGVANRTSTELIAVGIEGASIDTDRNSAIGSCKWSPARVPCPHLSSTRRRYTFHYIGILHFHRSASLVYSEPVSLVGTCFRTRPLPRANISRTSISTMNLQQWRTRSCRCWHWGRGISEKSS